MRVVIVATVCLSAVRAAGDAESDNKLATSALQLLQNAAQSVEKMHDRAEEQSDSVGEAFGQGLSQVATATNVLTEQAAGAMEQGMSVTMAILKNVLGVTEEMLKNVLTSLANLVFCLVMLYGFLKLPADFMLIVGLITFFVGPALVLGLFKLLGGVAFLAAWMPMLFIGVLFGLTLLKSSAVQLVAKRWHLDKNADGVVDLKDLVYAMQKAQWYIGFKEWIKRREATRFVKLDDLEAALVKDEPTIELLQAQIKALERKLDALLESRKLSA